MPVLIVAQVGYRGDHQPPQRCGVPVGVVHGHLQADVAHDADARVLGHAGARGHRRHPVPGGVDPHLRQARGLQRLQPMVSFRGLADRMAQLVREHELTRADMQASDARPQPVPQSLRDGHEPRGGVMADRTNRRTVMVALDALSAVTVLVCAAIFSAAGFNLAAIAVMQVVLAVLDAMETPTVQAALPQMFRSHGEDVMRRAMAVVNVVNQTSTLVPAVLGGVLYAAVGAMPMMGITIVGFGAAAGVEGFLRLTRPRRPRHRGRRPARGQTFPHPRTSSCAASGVDLRRAQLPGDGVCGGRLPLHGADRTGVRLHGVRPCIWSRGASGLLGALVGGRVARSLAMRRFPMAIAAFSLTILPQALAMTIPAGGVMRLAVLTASTCGTMIVITLANLIAVPAIQMGCPENMTGKVMSLALSASMCAQPLGQIAYGWAYSVYPAGAVLAVTFVLATAMLPLAAHVTRRF